ncbi:MAG TPA: tetratricopeptide repeat protein [Gammaproteobacteria bacterium]|nr:tetratricopeptide repeat protein [Gammaproteobacteria bacterium]
MAKEIEELMRRAMGLHQSGELEAAFKAYSKLIDLAPDYPEALNLHGVVSGQLGRKWEAVTSLQLATKLAPGNAVYQQNFGLALMNAGKPEEAEQPLRMAVYLAPELPQAHANLGNLYKQQKKFMEAAGCYEQALKLAPGDYKSWNNLGNTRRELKDLARAEDCLRRALAIKPDFTEALSNLGVVLAETGRLQDALACYEKALAREQQNADLYLNYGNALRDSGREQDASAAFMHAAVHLDPSNGAAWSSLGNAALALGDTGYAGECYRKAVTLHPEDPAIHFNLSLYQLLTGDLKAGFAEYEWGLRGDMRQPRRPFRQPRWQGEGFKGETLLIYAEQGIGDMLQFVRFLPEVKARGGRVILEVQQGLSPLLEGLAGADLIFERQNDGKIAHPFDRYVALLSLPALLGIELGNCDPRPGYLMLPERFKETARVRLKEDRAFKVALSWYGNPAHKNDRNRSCPLPLLAPLFEVPGVSWYAMSPGERTREDIASTGLPLKAFDLPFPEAAALLAEMDLVITVDSAHAHLAGALGKPVWVLLPFSPDWRWLLKRDDSPWYPSARLFRQSAPGDWAGLVVRLRSELETRPDKRGV